jgi:hypothetical protein
MRHDHTDTENERDPARPTHAGPHAPWFRVACVVAVVELAALAGFVSFILTPSPSDHSGGDGASVMAVASDALRLGHGDDGVLNNAPVTTTPPTTVAAPTTTVPPTPPTTVAVAPSTPPPAPTIPVRTAAATPAPTAGILPPQNPPASIAPVPNFLTVCAPSGYDDSAGCTASAVAAIDNGRQAEGLPAMALPSNWAALSAPEQLYVATNLERTVRGLPPLTAMASALDAAAGAGAATGDDPSPPAGFPFFQWGANWAGGVSSPLEAIYYWMYDDGPGSNNVDCTAGNPSGCWGHRDKILLSLTCTPCLMGTAFSAAGWGGQPSWAELLVGTSVSPATDFTWQQETPYLP